MKLLKLYCTFLIFIDTVFVVISSSLIINELHSFNVLIILLLIFILPFGSFLFYSNYYFFKYYFNFVNRMIVTDEELIVVKVRNVIKIKYDNVISVRKTKFSETERVIIKYFDKKQNKIIIFLNTKYPYSVQDFDYEHFTKKLSEKIKG